MQSVNLEEVLNQAIEYALQQGAESADAVVINSESLNVACRKAQVETVTQSNSSGLGLRVFMGKKQAVVSSNDITSKALKELAEKAVNMVKYIPEDPYCGINETVFASPAFAEKDFFDSGKVTVDELIERAMHCEQSALKVKGVTNIESASASWGKGSFGIANSKGFIGTYNSSSHGTSISVIAGEGTNRQTNDDFSSTVFRKDLEAPEAIGQRAGEMVVKKLSPKKISSQKVPVIFDPRIASQLLGYLVSAINGSNVSQEGKSFLANSLGKNVFAKGITIIDDPLLPKGFGSKPFDCEGTVPQKRLIVENGILNSWLLDLRSARKLKMASTGHGERGLSGVPCPTPTNFYIQAGQESPKDLIKSVKKGLYVRELMGSGFNLATGDISEGASGFWIENGELTYPVHEITIAGNLKDLFLNMSAANDLAFKYSLNAPTLLIEGLTIAGV